jgi:hypothetical protein
MAHAERSIDPCSRSRINLTVALVSFPAQFRDQLGPGCPANDNRPILLSVPTAMADDFVELAVIAPAASIKRIERSQIASCMLEPRDPMRVIVRLTDGSALVVTRASFERAGLATGIRLI